MPERSWSDERSARRREDRGRRLRGSTPDPQDAGEDPAGVAGDPGGGHRVVGRGGAGGAGGEATPRAAARTGVGADERHRGDAAGGAGVAGGGGGGLLQLCRRGGGGRRRRNG